MNFLIDESVDFQIVEILRKNKYSLIYISEMDPGISDDIIFDIANKNNSLLITADKDFGEFVFRQHLIPSGIILIRLAGLSPINKAQMTLTAIKQHISELKKSFTVISPGIVRIRHIESE